MTPAELSAALVGALSDAIEAGDRDFAPGFRHLLGRACRIGGRRERLADATLTSSSTTLEALTRDASFKRTSKKFYKKLI